MPKGTPIDLRGVIVTAVDSYGDNTGEFFVQDAEGGEFSGVKVVEHPQAVTGVMSVEIYSNARTLNPRSAADFVTGGVCP